MSVRYRASRMRVSADMASTQISDRPLPPAVRSCRPFERTVNDPSSMYQTASDSGVSCLR